MGALYNWLRGKRNEKEPAVCDNGYIEMTDIDDDIEVIEDKKLDYNCLPSGDLSPKEKRECLWKEFMFGFISEKVFETKNRELLEEEDKDYEARNKQQKQKNQISIIRSNKHLYNSFKGAVETMEKSADFDPKTTEYKRLKDEESLWKKSLEKAKKEFEEIRAEQYENLGSSFEMPDFLCIGRTEPITIKYQVQEISKAPRKPVDLDIQQKSAEEIERMIKELDEM